MVWNVFVMDAVDIMCTTTNVEDVIERFSEIWVLRTYIAQWYSARLRADDGRFDSL
jgi:hypothetical protein